MKRTLLVAVNSGKTPLATLTLKAPCATARDFDNDSLLPVDGKRLPKLHIGAHAFRFLMLE